MNVEWNRLIEGKDIVKVIKCDTIMKKESKKKEGKKKKKGAI